MTDSMTVGIIIGLGIGVVFMIIMYIFMALERDRYARREQQTIENLAKLLERRNNLRLRRKE